MVGDTINSASILYFALKFLTANKASYVIDPQEITVISFPSTKISAFPILNGVSFVVRSGILAFENLK